MKKFNLTDFLQLDTKGLLAVNGGSPCGGATTGPSNNASDPTSSSYGDSNGGGSSGDNKGNNTRQPVRTVQRPSGIWDYYGKDYGIWTDNYGEKHPFGPIDCTKTNNNKAANNSSSSSGGGSCSTPFSSPDSSSGKSNNPNGQGPSTTSSHPEKGSGDKEKKDNTPHVGGTCPGKDGGKTSSEKIMEQIIAKGDKTGIEDQFDPGEKKGCYVKGSYQCDEYVEEMIRKAGFKPKDYSIDDPSGKTINDHIKDLQASKKNYETDASKLTKGVYVVFMADKEKTLESHAALLFVEDGGGAFMYDNSSHNFRYKDSDGKTACYGGIERTNGNSAKAVCNQYVGYENFYFQQL